MKKQNTIPAFSRTLTAETILEALQIQQCVYLRKITSGKPIATSKLWSYAVKCHRGFLQNLKACTTYRDHLALHKAVTKRLAYNVPEFRNAAK